MENDNERKNKQINDVYLKYIKRRRKNLIIKIILVIFLCQVVVSAYQGLRYHVREEGYEDYCCVQMSRDCEVFFESMGIRVYQMRGYRDTGEQLETGGDKMMGHRWIILDFGWFQIPFECTALFIWNPLWQGYTIDVQTSEGYVINDKYSDDERYLVWQ